MKSYLLFAIVAFFGAIAVNVILDDAAAHKASQARTSAETLLALAGVVRDYKAAGGVLPDGESPATAIPLPGWLRASSLDRFALIRSGGQEFVIARYPKPADALRVRSAADKRAPARVGLAQGGTLRITGSPAAPPPLPAAVPNGVLAVPL